MVATRVSPRHFSGNRNVYDTGYRGLAALIRNLAIDNARKAVEVAAVTAMTDNSGGTATAEPYSFVDGTAVSTTAVFNAVSAGGVQRAALNTSAGKINNAHATIGMQLNIARMRLGLPAVSGLNTGTVVTAGTVASLDTAATTSNGTSAVDWASYVANMLILKGNHAKILQAFQEVITAIGVGPIASTMQVVYSAGFVLLPVGTVAAASTGASSVALADGTNLLAGMANNIASLVAKWNGVMIQAGLTALTDSSGGTASPNGVITTLGTMTPFTTVATDCAPKAAFDTLIAVYRNTLSSFAQRINLIAKEYGAPLLVDSTAGTPSTTIAAIAASLTAVTGTTVCLDAPTALSTWNAVKANIATVAWFLNNIIDPYAGGSFVVDGSTGVADTVAPYTLVAMATTGAGNSGATLQSIANTEMSADLLAAQTAVASLAADINGMLGATGNFRPLTVVAVA